MQAHGKRTRQNWQAATDFREVHRAATAQMECSCEMHLLLHAPRTGLEATC